MLPALWRVIGSALIAFMCALLYGFAGTGSRGCLALGMTVIMSACLPFDWSVSVQFFESSVSGLLGLARK